MLGATQQRWRPVPSVAKMSDYGSASQSTTRLDFASFLAIPHSDRIHQFLAYWMTLRGSSQLPRRADLDPLAIPSVLTGIWLITVNPEDDSFVTRLSGESVNRFFGRSMAGLDLNDALPEPAMEPIHSQLRRIRDDACLMLEQGDLMRPDGAFIYGERLFAPFSDCLDGDGREVDHIVSVTIASGLLSQTSSGSAGSLSQMYETPVL